VKIPAVSLQSRRLFYLSLAVIALLIPGLIYAWSIFSRAIAAEFPEYGAYLGQVFQVSMFAFCLAAFPGAALIKKASFKVALISAGIIIAAGHLLSALCAGLGLWAVFMLYGILVGAGSGMAYNATLSLVIPWFPDKVGLASGVMLMGFGAATLLCGAFADLLLSMMTWRHVFVGLAVADVALMAALASVVRPAPADLPGFLGLQDGPAILVSTPTQTQSIFSTKVFWLYCAWAAGILACGLAVIGRAAQGADALGVDMVVFAGFATLLVGLISFVNGMGRVVNGTLLDRFGLSFVMRLASCLMLVSMGMLLLAFQLSVPLTYVVSVVLVALPYSSASIVTSAFSRQRYKTEDYSLNLGICNLNIAVAALANIVLTMFLGPIGEAGSSADPLIFMVLCGISMAALVASLVFSKAYASDEARIAAERVCGERETTFDSV
jgi:OFA family oxalate/formate antiporter-like MFS transporter